MCVCVCEKLKTNVGFADSTAWDRRIRENSAKIGGKGTRYDQVFVCDPFVCVKLLFKRYHSVDICDTFKEGLKLKNNAVVKTSRLCVVNGCGEKGCSKNVSHQLAPASRRAKKAKQKWVRNLDNARASSKDMVPVMYVPTLPACRNRSAGGGRNLRCTKH